MVSMAQRKPEGGFQFISVVQLCMVWQAYHTAVIRKRDVRIWFAAHELVARRCKLKPGQQPTYTCEELSQVVGGEGEVSASLARLQACGLLRWDPQAVSFPSHPTPEHSFVRLPAMLAQIPNHRRQVPVPRRLLRFIAGGCRRAVLATILGHLFRCLYYHQGQCKPEGLCKASWIAEVFGISVRSVKDGRRHLEELGVMLRAETPHWVRNRYGQKMLMNLQWAGPPARTTAPGEPPEFAPLPAVSTTEFAPPDSNRKLPTGTEYQKPGGGGPSGTSHKEKTLGPPTLSHIVPEDLRDTGRLLALFAQATQQGLIEASEYERLQFVAAAEHARAVGEASPCGLFMYIVRNQLWQYITQDQEEAARQRLMQHCYGVTSRLRPALRPAEEGEGVSKDAWVVSLLEARLAQAGFTGEIVSVVAQYLPDWTRERWEQARAETRHRGAFGSPTGSASAVVAVDRFLSAETGARADL
jgi:hypothetical protein